MDAVLDEPACAYCISELKRAQKTPLTRRSNGGKLCWQCLRPVPNRIPVTVIAFRPHTERHTDTELDAVRQRRHTMDFQCPGKEAFAHGFDQPAYWLQPVLNTILIMLVRNRHGHTYQKCRKWLLQ